MAIMDDTFDGTNYQSARLRFDDDHDDLSAQQSLYGEILGGGGDDRILGTGVDQRIYGEAGDDTLRGGQGAPELRGGFGDDHLTMRTANAGSMGRGGPDNDIFLLSVDRDTDTGLQSHVTLDGGIGFDQLEIREFDGNVYYVDVSERLIGNDYDGPVYQEGIIDRIEAFVVVSVLDIDANMNGGQAAEAFQGGRGDDTILGRNGADTLVGGDGMDQLWGGNGADLMIDGRLPSTLALDLEDRDFVESLDGGQGDDTLISVAGKNDLFGGTGSDLFVLTGGADTIRGGEDQDRFIFSAAFNTPVNSDFTQRRFEMAAPDDTGDPIAIDRIDGALYGLDVTGGPGMDQLDLSTLTHATGGFWVDLEAQGGRPNFAAENVFSIRGVEHLIGTDYADTFIGATEAMLLEGHGGADTLYGGEASDNLRGGTGDDVIRGRARADVLEGNQGDDLLLAGRGRDKVTGGLGADTLRGGKGDDLLRGGSADTPDGVADTFLFFTGDGRDRIFDFETEGAQPDVLDLTGWSIGIRAGLDMIDVTAGAIDPVTGDTASDDGVWVLRLGLTPSLASDAVFLVDQTAADITDDSLIL